MIINQIGNQLPIKFTAPLSITDCKKRLQQSLGKAMDGLFTTLEGEVEMVDATTCKFRVYQDVHKMGIRTIAGYLYAESDTSTIVDAVFGIENQSEQLRKQFINMTIIMITITVISFLVVQQIVYAVIITLLLGSILYIEWRNRTNRRLKKEPFSQLVHWLERTLKN